MVVGKNSNDVFSDATSTGATNTPYGPSAFYGWDNVPIPPELSYYDFVIDDFMKNKAKDRAANSYAAWFVAFFNLRRQPLPITKSALESLADCDADRYFDGGVNQIGLRLIIADYENIASDATLGLTDADINEYAKLQADHALVGMLVRQLNEDDKARIAMLEYWDAEPLGSRKNLEIHLNELLSPLRLTVLISPLVPLPSAVSNQPRSQRVMTIFDDHGNVQSLDLH